MPSAYQPKNLKIVLHPNPRLRKISLEIPAEEIQKEKFQELLLDMAETMRNKDGAGLAAPQIGKNIRLIVIAAEKKPIFMINPRLTKKSWAKEVEDEGCLSVLNKEGEILYGPVERYKKINCSYLDQTGKARKIAATKLFARVIQHEIDHLDGVLFIDKIVGNKKLLAYQPAAGQSPHNF